ncbi:MAG: hypothetical protein F4X64_01305 [Chloroflexi bacterium]|nr:hypothetical protein [Chloroflexota bacterium]
MSTPNDDATNDLLRPNQQAAIDVERDASLQSEPEGFPGFVRTQVDINKAIVERMDAMQSDVRSLKDDMGDIKGKYARYEVARDARLITFDLGVQYLREIERDELAKWAQELSHKGIAAQTLRSFRQADLVIEASEKEQTVYVAIEVSYTADQRDTNRAIRNADLLRQLTGCEAKPVVASVKNDHHVSQQVEQELVHWHQIDEHALKAD